MQLYRPRVLGQWFGRYSPLRGRVQPDEVASHLRGASVSVFLEHPLFVVCPLEREQGQAEVFDGLEAPHPQEIFLQRADEALRHAVTFGRSHKARGTLNPEERDLLLEIGGQVVRPVVVTQPQPAGGGRR